MRFYSLSLLTPLAIAIQTIYLGVDTSSGQVGTYIAFFSDSDPCTQGTRFGSLSNGFENCNQNLTLIDHPNMTFTGCGNFTGYPSSLPTNVSDGGVPALKCVASGNPPTAPHYIDGFYQVCNDVNNGFVNVIQYCM